MASKYIERKLVAIVAADIVGYSRLMSADEEGTLGRLKSALRELIIPKIKEHHGRVIKTTGDGILVDFASVLDAVRCVVEVQDAMALRNTDEGAEHRLEFRCGINIGDVIVDGDDIFGDGVNIAARLEALAEPGGIMVSAAVRDQVNDRLPIVFEDLGLRMVKNISRSVHLYRISTSADGVQRKRSLEPGFVVPRLSILVLPFANIGGDMENEHFVDGITDTLTTDLSRLPGAFVIARNTAFSYKGKSPDVRTLGRELGIRYVMEGSVQATPSRFRVNAQLIDADTGAHIWAEHFDEPRADLFDMQDEITIRIARALDVQLVNAESRRALRERPHNPDALDLTMRGWSILYRPHTPAVLAEARGMFERALALEDGNVSALVGLAESHVFEIGPLWSKNPEEQLRQAVRAVGRALEIDPLFARAHCVHAIALRIMRRYDQALVAVEQALALDRNLAAAQAQRGVILTFMGRPEEAFAPVEHAIRLSPRDYNLSNWLYVAGIAHLLLEHFEAAIEWFLRAVEANPQMPHNYFLLASAYCSAGRRADALLALEEYLRLRPDATLAQLRLQYRFSTTPRMIAAYDRIEDTLRDLGMPA